MQTIADLGEIGAVGAITPSVLTPLDLPILRDGATWVLTTYTNPRIDVYDLRTRAPIASPGTVTIEDGPTGTIRWTPDMTNFYSGSFEARFIVENAGGDDEPSGKFRFSIAGGSQ